MAQAVYFSNTAVQTTLSGSISAGSTTITVGTTTGFPASFPYPLALDYGAAAEELVLVTAAAGTNLTVTRGYGGTSAQSHSLGAVVRHVYDATEANQFRIHEDATIAHGATGAVVGTTNTQTLTNKTLSGGTLTGTFSGTHTVSGVVTHTGGDVFRGGATTTDVVTTDVTGDSNPRFVVNANGTLEWGSGSAATDVAWYRNSASTLRTDGNVEIGGNLTVTGVGSHMVARKTADTARSQTTTPAADPHLTFTLVANAVYVMDGWIKYFADPAADLTVDFTIPSGTLGEWSGFAAGSNTSTATTVGYSIRTDSNDIDQARNFYGTSDSDLTAIINGLIRVGGTGGTYSLDWAQSTSSLIATVLFTDSWLRLHRIA